MTALGLPQVGCIQEGEEIPSRSHSLIVFGPLGSEPDYTGKHVWLLANGQSVNLPDESDAGIPLRGPLSLSFYGEREARYLFTKCAPSAVSSEEERLSENLYWVWTRLDKKGGVVNAAEVLEWLVMMDETDLRPGRKDRYVEDALLVLERQFEGDMGIKTSLRRLLIGGPQTWASRLDAAIELTEQALAVSEGVDVAQLQPRALQKIVLRHPALGIRCARKGRVFGKRLRQEEIRALLPELLPHCKNSKRLLTVAVMALSVRSQDVCSSLEEELRSLKWSKPGTSVLRSVPNGEGLLFSPLAAVWRYLRVRINDQSFVIPEFAGRDVEEIQPIDWRVLSSEDIGSASLSGKIDAHRRGGGLVDTEKRLISSSLLSSWLTYHRAPSKEGYKFKLTRLSYGKGVLDIETAWLEVFREIQRSAHKPLVRIRPWPAGFASALSLRYDVDRPVTEAQVRRILGIQERKLGCACASWYFFPGDLQSRQFERLLRESGQERGLHLEKAFDGASGMGVTHHSGAISDYWQGNASNRVLEQKACAYGEHLSAQLFRPRPAWLQDGPCKETAPVKGGELGSLWLSALHFPLEGSSSDLTLDYFDRLSLAFQRQKQSEGHIVIGSHPDLGQDILEEAIDREQLAGLWCATVGRVISRCKALYSLRNIMATSRDEKTVQIDLGNAIKDAVIEIDWVSGMTTSHSLNGNQRVIIEAPATSHSVAGN